MFDSSHMEVLRGKNIFKYSSSFPFFSSSLLLDSNALHYVPAQGLRSGKVPQCSSANKKGMLAIPCLLYIQVEGIPDVCPVHQVPSFLPGHAGACRHLKHEVSLLWECEVGEGGWSTAEVDLRRPHDRVTCSPEPLPFAKGNLQYVV